MIKNRFLAAVMAVLAGVSVISCDELQEIIDTVIEVSISSDSDAFDANGQAVVKLNLNAASNKDINVIIGISAEAQSGFTAVSADALDFEGSVTIPAGTQQVPVTIKLNEKAQAGQPQPVDVQIGKGITRSHYQGPQEAHESEHVGGDPGRHPLGHPDQNLSLCGIQDGGLNPCGLFIIFTHN